MLIHGEIEKEGAMYSAICEPLGAYGQGKSRQAAIAMMLEAIHQIAAAYQPLAGFKVVAEDDGESTLRITSNDAPRLLTILLRCQRQFHRLSLADVTQKMGAKSRNGFARFEQGRSEPTLSKLIELLAHVAPELAVAIVPRTAAVIPAPDVGESAVALVSERGGKSKRRVA